MGSVITFAQQKGGAGKTTLLAHLAHAAAQKGRSVALVDLDPQGSLTRWAAAAGIDGIAIRETASYRAGSDIREAGRQNDLTLVDCPGSVASVLEAAIRESDLVLCPCQASVMDIWASEATLKMCADEGIPARIVLNRVAARGQSGEEAASALKAVGGTPLKTRFGNRIAYARSMGAGTTALGLAGQARAKAEVAAFIREVDRLLKKPA